MAWIRPVGSLAITAASNPYVAISGLSLTLVSPGMTINIGSRTHKEGKDYSLGDCGRRSVQGRAEDDQRV
jgi:hypothetical protein